MTEIKRLLPILLLLVTFTADGGNFLCSLFSSCEVNVRGCKGKYVGEFKNGKPHGQGKCTRPHRSDFRPGSEYVGGFKDGMRHGQGTITYPDSGEKYVGEWKDNAFHGQGTFTAGQSGSDAAPWSHIYSIGHRYVGEWKDGRKHGQGTSYNATGGSLTSSAWRRNKATGSCIAIEPNEGKFVGVCTDKMNIENDWWFWDGVLYGPSGQIRGTFVAGRYCDGCTPSGVLSSPPPPMEMSRMEMLLKLDELRDKSIDKRSPLQPKAFRELRERYIETWLSNGKNVGSSAQEQQQSIQSTLSIPKDTTTQGKNLLNKENISVTELVRKGAKRLRQTMNFPLRMGEWEAYAVTADGELMVYELRAISSSTFVVTESWRSKARKQMIARVCANSKMRWLLSLGPKLEYRYYDTRGKHLTAIRIGASDC